MPDTIRHRRTCARPGAVVTKVRLRDGAALVHRCTGCDGCAVIPEQSTTERARS